MLCNYTTYVLSGDVIRAVDRSIWLVRRSASRIYPWRCVGIVMMKMPHRPRVICVYTAVLTFGRELSTVSKNGPTLPTGQCCPLKY